MACTGGAGRGHGAPLLLQQLAQQAQRLGGAAGAGRGRPEVALHLSLAALRLAPLLLLPG